MYRPRYSISFFGLVKGLAQWMCQCFLYWESIILLNSNGRMLEWNISLPFLFSLRRMVLIQYLHIRIMSFALKKFFQVSSSRFSPPWVVEICRCGLYFRSRPKVRSDKNIPGKTPIVWAISLIMSAPILQSLVSSLQLLLSNSQRFFFN